MPYRQLEPLSKQLTIVIGLTVVGFMAFGLALSYYRNELFDQALRNIEGQNEDLQRQIGSWYRDLDYYQSVQFRDKYAKENLGLVRPGEKVLILTQQERDTELPEGSGDMTLAEQQQAKYLELLRQMPVIEHWKLYLFHRERIEELKRGTEI